MAVERYRVQVDGQWLDVTVEASGDRVRVRCGENTWDADLKQYSDTSYISLLLGGESVVCLVEKVDDTYTVLRGWENYRVRVRPAWVPAQARDEAGVETVSEVAIESPLVGVVAEIAVKPGQPVERGDLLLIIEAMKMQNEIRAPRAGAVRAIRVKAGQKVTMRQPLLVLS